MNVDPAVLARLDKPGPRYTSYPIVPAWSDGWGHDQHAARLREAGRAGNDLPLSLYVHLPFCKEMCTYCGCNVVISMNRERHADYVDAVRDEIDLVADMLAGRRKLLQLHYGGGTPTTLDESLLLRLWDKITERFSIERDAEVAIEIDPCVTRREQLALLRGMGFNRVSMGVQDFDPVVQAAVNRRQTVEETEDLVGYARLLGFSGINFDLIYGLPHQRLETFEKSLDEVLRIGPDRVAVFSYAHLPDARTHQRKIDEAALPRGLEKYRLAALAREKLTAAGYQAIGLDHYARHDDELAVAQRERRLSRNFQGYTVRPAPDIVAVGATAISDVRGSYAQNLRPLGAYAKSVRSGRLPVSRGAGLSDDDLLRRDAINAIMCNFYLDLTALGRKHGVNAETHLASSLHRLRGLEAEGLVKMSPGAVEVTPLGQIFVRNVAMELDAYLERDGHRLPQMSRTV